MICVIMSLFYSLYKFILYITYRQYKAVDTYALMIFYLKKILRFL